MSGYGAERALMALPPDSRLHVQLSRYFYASTLKRVRSNLDSNRSGPAVIEVATPADAPVLEIVLDRRSLYRLRCAAVGQPNGGDLSRTAVPPACPMAPCERSKKVTRTQRSVCRTASI